LAITGNIIFDLSALIAMEQHRTPRGIPRVELAYAKHLLNLAPERLSFCAFWGRLGVVPTEAAVALVEALDTCWAGGEGSSAAGEQAAAIVWRLRREILLRGASALYSRSAGSSIFLIVSHPLLGRMRTLQRLKDSTGARFVCLVHDLIGIDFPRFVRRRQRRRHRDRMDSVARFADAVIVNSSATGSAFRRRYGPAGFEAPLVVAPLGIDLGIEPRTPAAAADPYFVCVATIEPRKNHRLLFSLWQRLAAELGHAAPRLVLVGHRGWKSKSILRNATRPPIRSGLIEEHNSASDAEVARLLLAARALLYPTFAEGYGLPVAEALALRVPVICSDLAELREVGRNAPEFLDPHDKSAWLEVVRDYAGAGSGRREAQLRRMANWRAPSWNEHFAIVQPLLDRLSC
jgi:glycosyltransferase involved in cell wall biosynthesis